MTVRAKSSKPTNGILGIMIQKDGVIVTASGQVINFTGNVNVTDVLWVATIEILSSFGWAFTDLSDVPGSYTGWAGMFVQVNPWENWLQFIDMQSWIEALTSLDLSGVDITLWNIGWDIAFDLATNINRTNTTNTGTQDFWNTYIGNYDWAILNIYGWSIFNISNSYFNSTNNTYTYSGDIINYINNTNITYDETTNVTYEWDIYIGGTIIQMGSNVFLWWTVTQSGAWVAFTNPNNVKICDSVLAVASVIDPTLLDHIKLIIWGSIAGNDLGQWITWGNPAIYGNAWNLRGNVLTPAIVNNANFGVAFQFGDSQTLEVSNFGFAINPTDTILWVKVEVIFSSNATSVSVDCITLIVYSTAGTSVLSVKPSDMNATNSPSDGDIPVKGTWVDQFTRQTPIFQKIWTTSAMSWTTLDHTDADVTATSIVSRTASATPNGFIQVDVGTAWHIIFTSTASETCSFTYLLSK